MSTLRAVFSRITHTVTVVGCWSPGTVQVALPGCIDWKMIFNRIRSNFQVLSIAFALRVIYCIQWKAWCTCIVHAMDQIRSWYQMHTDTDGSTFFSSSKRIKKWVCVFVCASVHVSMRSPLFEMVLKIFMTVTRSFKYYEDSRMFWI